MKKVAIVVGIAVVLAAIGGCASYNRLVGLDEGVKNAWAQVDTVLQRRYDLIPNLVNTVKGYATHEKTLFEDIARLRSQWGAAKSPDARVEAATQMEGALSRLLVVVENYPELKANQNFTALMDELAGTENRIAVERGRYNGVVREYNTSVRRIPTVFMARMFGFDESKRYFEAVEQAKEAPKVQF